MSYRKSKKSSYSTVGLLKDDQLTEEDLGSEQRKRGSLNKYSIQLHPSHSKHITEFFQVYGIRQTEFIISDNSKVVLETWKIEYAKKHLKGWKTLAESEDITVRRLAISILSDLEIKDDELHLDEQGFDCLKKLFSRKEQSIQILTLSLSASLSKNKSICYYFLQEIPLTTIIPFLKSADHLIDALKLISNLAIGGSNRKELVKHGVLNLIIPLLIEKSEFIYLVHSTIALSHFLIEEDYLKLISIKDVLPVIIEGIQSSELALQRGSSTCLANMLNSDDENLRNLLIQLNGFETLVTVLQRTSDNAVQIGLCVSLANLTKVTEFKKQLIQKQGFLSFLLNLLSKAEHPELQFGILMIFNNLTQVAKNELKEKKFIQLFKTLQKSPDRDISLEASQTLADLGMFNEGMTPSLVFRSGTCSFRPDPPKSKMVYNFEDQDLLSLIEVLKDLKNISAETKKATEKLREISKKGEITIRLVTLNTLPVILNLFRIPRGSFMKADLSILVDLLKIIKHFLLLDSTCRSYFHGQDFLDRLAELLVTEGKNEVAPLIHAATLDLITALSYNQPVIQNQLTKLVPDIVQLLKFSLEEKVKRTAVRALGGLCANNRNNQQTIRKLFVIPEIIKCLENESINLKKNAVGALQAISDNDLKNQELVKKANGFKYLISILEDPKSDEELISICAATAKTFVRFNERNQNEFKKLNICAILVQRFQITTSDYVIAYLLTFLLELARDNRKIQETFCLAGGVPILLNILKTCTFGPALFTAEGFIWMSARRNKKIKTSFLQVKIVEALTTLLKHESKNVQEGAKKALILFNE